MIALSVTIPAAFQYADAIWSGLIYLGVFSAGYIVGGICQR